MKKWGFFFIIVIGLYLTVFYQHRFILSEYAKFFTINNASPGADAIVVLSGGKSTRIPHALELFSKGYAPQLIFTEEKKTNQLLPEIFPTNIEIVNAMIEKLNLKIPIIKIKSTKGGATSTFDEAYDLKQFIEKKGFKRLILVTDSFHSRRALYAFKKIFSDSNLLFEMSAAKNEIFNENNWWTSDQGIAAYVLESIKYPIYLLSSKNFDFIRND